MYLKKEKRKVKSVFIQKNCGTVSSTFRDRPFVVQFVAVNGNKKRVDDSESSSEIQSKKETKVPAIAAVAERNHK